MDSHHLNVIKYCPRCGSSKFPAVSNKSFKCNGCRFHFYINSAAAVAGLIFNEKGELLFTRRSIHPHSGMLDLPGGFVDPNENVEDAMVRELKEELNLEVVSLEYFASCPNEYEFSGFNVFTVDMAFIIKAKTLEGLTAQDDISGYEFIALYEVDFNELPAKSMQYFVKKLQHG